MVRKEGIDVTARYKSPEIGSWEAGPMSFDKQAEKKRGGGRE